MVHRWKAYLIILLCSCANDKEMFSRGIMQSSSFGGYNAEYQAVLARATFLSYTLTQTTRVASGLTDFGRDGAEFYQFPDYPQWMFVFNGWNNDQSPQTNNEVYRVLLSDFTVTKLSNAPWFRRHTFGLAGLTANGSRAYVYGKDIQAGTGNGHDWWTVDCDSNGALTYTSKGTLPYSERVLTGTWTDGTYFYALGGEALNQSVEGTGPTDLWRCDGTTWTQVATGLTWANINLAGTCAFRNGVHYVCGGGFYNLVTSDKVNGDVVRKSTDLTNWSTIASLPYPVQYPKCVTFDNKVFKFFGVNGTDKISYLTTDETWITPGTTYGTTAIANLGAFTLRHAVSGRPINLNGTSVIAWGLGTDNLGSGAQNDLFTIAKSNVNYTAPSNSFKNKENAFIQALKDAGYWDELDFIANFRTDGDSYFQMINWKQPNSIIGEQLGGLTFSSTNGVTGNGTTGRLRWYSLTFSKFVQNSCSIIVITSSKTAAASKAIITVRVDQSGVYRSWLTQGGGSSRAHDNNDNSNSLATSNFRALRRTGSANYTVYMGTNTQVITQASAAGGSGVDPKGIDLMALVTGQEAQVVNFSTDGILFVMVGSGVIDPAQVKTIYENIYGAIP